MKQYSSILFIHDYGDTEIYKFLEEGMIFKDIQIEALEYLKQEEIK